MGQAAGQRVELEQQVELERKLLGLGLGRRRRLFHFEPLPNDPFDTPN